DTVGARNCSVRVSHLLNQRSPVVCKSQGYGVLVSFSGILVMWSLALPSNQICFLGIP
ncbi:hypothetical protein U1Q18_043184, partial [Sarracenia purpurea var. burkii]